MVNKAKQIIDPDRLSKTWELSWKHYQLPKYFEEDDSSVVDTGSYIFDFVSKEDNNYSLSFHDREPDAVTVRFDKIDLVIRLKNITRIVYVRYKKEVIFESRIGDYFSELCVGHNGRVVLHINKSIKDYQLSSFCEIEENEQKEINGGKKKPF